VRGAGSFFNCPAKFQLSNTGHSKIELEGGGEAWLDGVAAPRDARGHLDADLPSGEHTIAVRLNAKRLPEFLRADCPNPKFLGN
jgi:hypothetical protein